MTFMNTLGRETSLKMYRHLVRQIGIGCYEQFCIWVSMLFHAPELATNP
jgi:hypothetical protein